MLGDIFLSKAPPSVQFQHLTLCSGGKDICAESHHNRPFSLSSYTYLSLYKHHPNSNECLLLDNCDLYIMASGLCCVSGPHLCVSATRLANKNAKRSCLSWGKQQLFPV